MPAPAGVRSHQAGQKPVLAGVAHGLPLPLPQPQLLENMYNMSFHVRGLELRFNANGYVDMEYDLKMWVWQSPTPVLHTVGAFNGSLWLQLSQMWGPGNQVGARHMGHHHTDAPIAKQASEALGISG